jgi:hypothetical protein
MGILRLDCHQNISSNLNSTLLDECLDREMGPSSFYFVASASITNPNGQNLVAPMPITIHVEDANDNPPWLELFNQKEMISILNGQMEGGPLVVAIRDEDRQMNYSINSIIYSILTVLHRIVKIIFCFREIVPNFLQFKN